MRRSSPGTTTGTRRLAGTTESGGTAAAAGEPEPKRPATRLHGVHGRFGGDRGRGEGVRGRRQTGKARRRRRADGCRALCACPPTATSAPKPRPPIRRLQARHGLTVDGIVGPATWEVLGVHGAETLTPPPDALPKPHHHHQSAAAAVDVSDTASGGEAEAPASSEAPAGDAVERLQSALKMPVDGEFGPETEAAVQRLQTRHGLTPDGVVGPATWALLTFTDSRNSPRRPRPG